MGGLAFGHGIRQNLGEAYTFLMNTWQLGDKVFVFGFSRGAYTARALCGMLHRVGLLRPGSEISFRTRYACMRGASGRLSDPTRPEGWDRMDRFAGALPVRPNPDSSSFPVEYLGVFRHRQGHALPLVETSGGLIRSAAECPSGTTRGLHRREAATVYENADTGSTRGQRSPGKRNLVGRVHSDVGGGFARIPSSAGLPCAGCLRRPRRGHPDQATAVQPAFAIPPHRIRRVRAYPQDGLEMDFHDYRTRPIPSGARVHASVRTRIRKDPQYAKKIPANPMWDEESWFHKISRPGLLACRP